MSVQVVAARFNENPEWLLGDMENVIIYNKGAPIHYFKNIISLPNVGREAHTYLYHIVENYDRLADITIFIQAKIADHNFIETMDNLKSRFVESASINGFSNNYNTYEPSGNTVWAKPDFNIILKDNLIKKYNVPVEFVDKIIFRDWFQQFIYPVYPDKLHMYNAALFAMSKKKIYSRPKTFYEGILSQLVNDNAPIEAHFMERSWFYLFNCHL